MKLCMTIESGPELILTLFWAIYDLLLIQCRLIEGNAKSLRLNSISPDLWRRCHPRARTRFWHCWWLFFSWSKIFSFPFIKHAFSYNTVFNGFFEDKSNVVTLGSRSAEILSLEALWRFTREGHRQCCQVVTGLLSHIFHIFTAKILSNTVCFLIFHGY